MRREENITRETIKTLLAQGKYPAQIARELGITRQAVDYHIKKIHLEEKEKKQEKSSKNPIRDWRNYNDTHVAKGKLVLDLLLDPQIIEEEKQWLAEANNNKVGAPFKYSDGLINLILTAKALFKLDYRKLEGVMQNFLRLIGLPCPDYTTIWYRAQKLESEIITFVSQKEEDKNKEIALDSTGRSQQIKGNYRKTKYGDNLRRFIKIHVALNITTGEVEAAIVSDENTADVEKAPELIEKSAENGKPAKVYADRGYDCAELRGLLLKNDIVPIIRPKITQELDQARAEFEEILKEYVGEHRFGDKKGILYGKINLLKKEHPNILGKMNRLTTMIECIANYEDWRDRNKYGKRAYIENLFSRETLIFGDEISSKKYSQAEKESFIRYTLLNAFNALMKTKTESERQSVYKYILNRIEESFYKKSLAKLLKVRYLSFA